MVGDKRTHDEMAAAAAVAAAAVANAHATASVEAAAAAAQAAAHQDASATANNVATAAALEQQQHEAQSLAAAAAAAHAQAAAEHGAVNLSGVAQQTIGDVSKQGGNASPSIAGLNASMLGLPFMLPSAALMAMNSVQQAEGQQPAGTTPTMDDATLLALQQSMAAAAAAAASMAGAEGDKATGGDSSPQQQQLLQQQLQLLQMQQQHLQNMSPSDLSAMATMAHQMALGMVMMPMMPLMMSMNQSSNGSGSEQASPQDGQQSPDDRGSSTEYGGHAESLGLGGTDAAGMALMGGATGFGNDDTPKRKRGRPSKKDALTRNKAELEKALKQFPLWGYGMPLPFLPGFVPSALPGGMGADQSGQELHVAPKDDDDINRLGKGMTLTGGKKKTRGTGKPRGRPRTRPRPGEIIRRVKPPPIAPATVPGMQEYFAQKMAEWKTTQPPGTIGPGEDNRLGSLGAALLPGDHE